jgi:hypothetical protein
MKLKEKRFEELKLKASSEIRNAVQNDDKQIVGCVIEGKTTSTCQDTFDQ